MKRHWILGLALASLALVATGCDLYVEDSEYYYCDETGCYYCDDWGCYPDGGAPEGGVCNNDADCMGGCFCSDDGICEEAGFCDRDNDCPVGFHCDERDSCTPDGPRGCTSDDQCPDDWTCNQTNGLCEEFSCTADTDCEQGSYCDEDSGDCIVSSTCEDDDGCGEGFECDEARQSCMPDDGICQTDEECGEDMKCDGAPAGECVAKVCADYDYDECRAHEDSCDTIVNLSNCTDNGGTCSIETPQFCLCTSAAFIACLDKEP